MTYKLPMVLLQSTVLNCAADGDEDDDDKTTMTTLVVTTTGTSTRGKTTRTILIMIVVVNTCPRSFSCATTCKLVARIEYGGRTPLPAPPGVCLRLEARASHMKAGGKACLPTC